jgi:hypothetical protein
VRGRWKFVTLGDGHGSWSPDSKKYEYGYVGAYSPYTLWVVTVPSCRTIKLKQPYKIVSCAAYSNETDEIAVIGGPGSSTSPPDEYVLASVLAPRYGQSGGGNRKYPAYYPKITNFSVGSLDQPSTIRWSSSDKYIAFVNAYKEGEGPVCLINVPQNKYTPFGNIFGAQPDDVWVLDNGWVISSYGGAGSVSGSHHPMVGLPPLRHDGIDQVVNVYQASSTRFLLAVFRQNTGDHPPLEIWEGRVSPTPKLTRKLLTVPADYTGDHPGTSPITFTQHGETVWIPVGNTLCSYQLKLD